MSAWPKPPVTQGKPIVESMVGYDPDEFFDERCWDKGQHQAVSVATVNYGKRRRTDVTVLCLFCNLKIATWKEYPHDFVF